MTQPNDTPRRDNKAPAFGPGRGGPMGGGPMRGGMGSGEKPKSFRKAMGTFLKYLSPIPCFAYIGTYFCDCQYRFYDIGSENCLVMPPPNSFKVSWPR